MFCPQPFEQVEIFHDGKTYTCCPAYIDFFSIGNIFESSFDEIWNGKNAREFRERIIYGDFSSCRDTCYRKGMLTDKKTYFNSQLDKYPEIVGVSSDNSCNVCCRICRDEHINNHFDDKALKKEIEEIWLPIFKNAKIARFGTTGEPFFSKKERMLIQKIAQEYPEVKFHFHTNGILGNKRLLEKLKVYKRINEITVSIHAATKETYDKVVLDGNWKKVLNNLELYSKMKKEHLLEQFRLIFVVTSYNYKEMPLFAELAKKYGATVDFWGFRTNETKMGREYTKYSVIEPEHEEHQNLLEVLKNPIFDDLSINLYSELSSLRKK